MSKLKYEVKPESTALHEVELDLLIAVLGEALRSRTGKMPEHGTVAMYEQRRWADEECVFIVNMEKGEANYLCEDGKTTPSVYLAREAITTLAQWPVEEKYDCDLSAWEFEVPNGVHYGEGDDGYQAFVMNATLGRFIFSSYINYKEDKLDKNEAILVVLADTLRRLRPEDKALHYGMKVFLSQNQYNAERKKLELLPVVEKIFREGKLPEYKVWKKWRNQEVAGGGMTVFFEEAMKNDLEEDCDFGAFYGYESRENWDEDDYDGHDDGYDATMMGYSEGMEEEQCWI